MSDPKSSSRKVVEARQPESISQAPLRKTLNPSSVHHRERGTTRGGTQKEGADKITAQLGEGLSGRTPRRRVHGVERLEARKEPRTEGFDIRAKGESLVKSHAEESGGRAKFKMGSSQSEPRSTLSPSGLRR